MRSRSYQGGCVSSRFNSIYMKFFHYFFVPPPASQYGSSMEKRRVVVSTLSSHVPTRQSFLSSHQPPAPRRRSSPTAGCTRYFPGFYRIANGRLSNRISQPPSTQQGGTCAASVHPPPIHSMASTRLFTRYNLSKPEDERVRARCPYFSLHLPYDSHPSASSVSAIQPTHALPLSTRLSKLSRAQASVPLTTMLGFTVAASSSTSSSASADAPFPNQHHPRPTNKQRGGSLSFAVCVPSPAE